MASSGIGSMLINAARRRRWLASAAAASNSENHQYQP